MPFPRESFLSVLLCITATTKPAHVSCSFPSCFERYFRFLCLPAFLTPNHNGSDFALILLTHCFRAEARGNNAPSSASSHACKMSHATDFRHRFRSAPEVVLFLFPIPTSIRPGSVRRARNRKPCGELRNRNEPENEHAKCKENPLLSGAPATTHLPNWWVKNLVRTFPFQKKTPRSHKNMLAR